MTPPLERVDIERFRSVVARRFGLFFEDGKLGFLADILRRRLEVTSAKCEAYLASLEETACPPEIEALAPELTVGETYFFRHMDQFRAFVDVALPDRRRANDRRKRLRILSAGCASGEEAYSLAMLVRAALPASSWEVSIRGVDVNPAMIEKAVRARYSTWAFRETPPEIQREWFRQDGRDAVLDDVVRASVTFATRNLVENDDELWQPSTYDVVFFRNVMMYFTPEVAQAVVARIARALAPGGYLFLGHAETLRGLSPDFHLRHTHGTFYYQRKGEGERASVDAGAARLPAASARASSADRELARALETGDTWVEAIEKAARRIHALTATQEPAAATVDAGPRPPWNLARALDLLHKERFAESLEIVQALPPESERDPDVLLLQAVLLTHSGRLAAAEEICRRLLELDDLNAGAHYVLAMCRESARDARGAADHDQIAAYLDPGFAMPRLHLGLLARRAGDLEAARRELRHALVLLQQEDASRLLLFGGGFHRDALTSLCRAELQVCGGEA